MHVELTITYTEPAVRGDTSSGSVTKAAKLETGAEIRVPLFCQGRRKDQDHHGNERVLRPRLTLFSKLYAHSSKLSETRSATT